MLNTQIRLSVKPAFLICGHNTGIDRDLETGAIWTLDLVFRNKITDSCFCHLPGSRVRCLSCSISDMLSPWQVLYNHLLFGIGQHWFPHFRRENWEIPRDCAIGTIQCLSLGFPQFFPNLVTTPTYYSQAVQLSCGWGLCTMLAICCFRAAPGGSPPAL